MPEDYSKRHRAGLKELQSTLEAIGKNLDRPVKGYLIGGCAMAIRGLKDATKDADLVVETKAERDALYRVMKSLDYDCDQASPMRRRFPKEYEGFQGDLYTKAGSVGLDVFEKTVMDKFTLTPTMKARASELYRYGKLELHLCSNEDICLLKSVTYRPDDDQDVITLIGTGLNVDIMKGELRKQPRREGVGWPEHVAGELRAIATRLAVEIPWIAQLEE